MKPNDTDAIRPPRTLGLPVSAERALMGKAYENYATAQLLQVSMHNEWRRVRRLFAHTDSVGKFVSFNDGHAEVKRALRKATEASFYLADAKAQYRQAKNVAMAAAA